jgi:hypothetical protein
MVKRQINLEIKTFNFGAIFAAEASTFAMPTKDKSADRLHSLPVTILNFLWGLAFGFWFFY